MSRRLLQKSNSYKSKELLVLTIKTWYNFLTLNRLKAGIENSRAQCSLLVCPFLLADKA